MSFIEHCRQSHSLPDICCPEPGLEFTAIEALALWKFLAHEHIPYEDEALLQAVRKLSRFVDKLE